MPAIVEDTTDEGNRKIASADALSHSSGPPKGLGQPQTSIDRLIAAGRVTRPRGDLLAQLPPRGRISTAASDALADERAERL